MVESKNLDWILRFLYLSLSWTLFSLSLSDTRVSTGQRENLEWKFAYAKNDRTKSKWLKYWTSLPTVIFDWSVTYLPKVSCFVKPDPLSTLFNIKLGRYVVLTSKCYSNNDHQNFLQWSVWRRFGGKSSAYKTYLKCPLLIVPYLYCILRQKRF